LRGRLPPPHFAPFFSSSGPSFFFPTRDVNVGACACVGLFALHARVRPQDGGGWPLKCTSPLATRVLCFLCDAGVVVGSCGVPGRSERAKTTLVFCFLFLFLGAAAYSAESGHRGRVLGACWCWGGVPPFPTTPPPRSSYRRQLGLGFLSVRGRAPGFLACCEYVNCIPSFL
jgi:hypothetical protein